MTLGTLSGLHGRCSQCMVSCKALAIQCCQQADAALVSSRGAARLDLMSRLTERERQTRGQLQGRAPEVMGRRGREGGEGTRNPARVRPGIVSHLVITGAAGAASAMLRSGSHWSLARSSASTLRSSTQHALLVSRPEAKCQQAKMSPSTGQISGLPS